MKIIDCRKGNLDIDYNGKKLRCWGDMTVNGFSVVIDVMEWITPDTRKFLSDEEINRVVPEIRRYCRTVEKFKLEFRDNRGRRIWINKFMLFKRRYSGMEKWEGLTAVMCDIKREIDRADKEKLWEYHYPEVAAQMSEVELVQKKLGVKLPEEYIKFLLCANGWKSFYQHVDLFGTKDFETERIEYARKLLSIEVQHNTELNKIHTDLLPIAVSKADKDLFVLVLKEGESYGQVIWLAGGEIERFENFKSCFEAMIEYNKEELKDLEEEKGSLI